MDNKKQLKQFIDNSYRNVQKPRISGYVRDNNLSGRRVQVYHNPDTGSTNVVHRGTQGWKDVATDAAVAVGRLTGRKRYKHAKKVQAQAEAKYGDVHTIGHSLGGLVAEKVGRKGKVSTLNKAVGVLELNKRIKNKHQTDIRSTGDVVSALGGMQKKNNVHEIRAPFFSNPLSEHSSVILQR
jgi:hypothetical protein